MPALPCIAAAHLAMPSWRVVTPYVIRNALLLGARALAGRETAKPYHIHSSQLLRFYMTFDAGGAVIPDQEWCRGSIITTW